jgi:DNA-binding transcriptional regulator YiaG
VGAMPTGAPFTGPIPPPTDPPSCRAGRRLSPRSSARAMAMGVTLQTACNWFDGLSRPTGDKVALLAFMHPEAFGRIMGDK